jgi:hypothetical protein
MQNFYVRVPWAGVAWLAACFLSVQTAANGDSADTPAGTTMFAQPILNGIAGTFHVPLKERKSASDPVFSLLLWQPNPNQSNGELVPTSWSAGDMTGFYPTGSLSDEQAGFRDEPKTSTVQIAGDTVGAYLNSRDLPQGSQGDKMMITPEFQPPTSQRTCPFASPGMALVNSLDLQIPTARDLKRPGSLTYVNADFGFEDLKTHTRVSYKLSFFHRAATDGSALTPEYLEGTEVGGFDGPSHSFQVGNAVAPGSRVVTMLAGSATFQGEPWRGWRRFAAAITYDNFKTALAALKAKDPAFPGSGNPADYLLRKWHLNAELKFSGGPAELGWSMRQARVSLVPESQLNRA